MIVPLFILLFAGASNAVTGSGGGQIGDSGGGSGSVAPPPGVSGSGGGTVGDTGGGGGSVAGPGGVSGTGGGTVGGSDGGAGTVTVPAVTGSGGGTIADVGGGGGQVLAPGVTGGGGGQVRDTGGGGGTTAAPGLTGAGGGGVQLAGGGGGVTVGGYLSSADRLREPGSSYGLQLVAHEHGDILDYPVRYDLDPGDQVVASAWTVLPAGLTIVAGSSKVDADGTVNCQVQGGIVGRVYELINVVTTGSGRSLASTIALRIVPGV